MLHVDPLSLRMALVQQVVDKVGDRVDVGKAVDDEGSGRTGKRLCLYGRSTLMRYS